jgi:hypothetical protein
MTAPPVWKRGFASLSAVLVVVVVASVAHAGEPFRGGAFRKKKAPATDSSDTSPSGDSTEAAPADAPAAAPAAATEAATPESSQAEDKDYPEAQAERDKARADAALQRQMRNAELAKQREQGTPFYQKWQFWAIAGGVVVGTVLAIWGGTALAHQINGGDVRACPMDATAGCFGQGR